MECVEGTLELVDSLQSIYESWTEKEEVTGVKCEDNYMLKSIKYGDLPPVEGASKKNHHVLAYYDNMNLIGFTDIYIGYPDKSCLWIGLMVIDKKYRQQGYGSKIIDTLIKKFPNLSYGIGVDTKNLIGVKFWHKQGFRELFSVHIDGTFGVLGLKKTV